jgi:hypothetical protein
MAKKKVADLLVEILAEAVVRMVYGLSGDSLNGITDSIREKADFGGRDALQAVLSGRGDEVIDLARVNLLR